ncbi:MAG TPA: hypothetical protein VFA04_25960 [Bryobacteraceae bacterium]|nr:hypothetical protein [Bryobacteraceae bacterium]
MKSIVIIATALACGFVGGAAGTLTILAREHARPAELVRARSFELVGERGQVISHWGLDRAQNAVIAFSTRGLAGGVVPGRPPLDLTDPNNQTVAIGVLNDDLPFLAMRGADRKTRVRLMLTLWDQPSLLMEDDTGPRISLGIAPSDTPGPRNNSWSLMFVPDVASIGFLANTEKGQTYVKGGVYVRPGKVKYP